MEDITTVIKAQKAIAYIERHCTVIKYHTLLTSVNEDYFWMDCINSYLNRATAKLRDKLRLKGKVSETAIDKLSNSYRKGLITKHLNLDKMPSPLYAHALECYNIDHPKRTRPERLPLSCVNKWEKHNKLMKESLDIVHSVISSSVQAIKDNPVLLKGVSLEEVNFNPGMNKISVSFHFPMEIITLQRSKKVVAPSKVIITYLRRDGVMPLSYYRVTMAKLMDARINPHCGNRNGPPCFGGYSYPIEYSLKQGDMFSALYNIKLYNGSVDSSDEWGRTITRHPNIWHLNGSNKLACNHAGLAIKYGWAFMSEVSTNNWIKKGWKLYDRNKFAIDFISGKMIKKDRALQLNLYTSTTVYNKSPNVRFNVDQLCKDNVLKGTIQALAHAEKSKQLSRRRRMRTRREEKEWNKVMALKKKKGKIRGLGNEVVTTVTSNSGTIRFENVDGLYRRAT